MNASATVVPRSRPARKSSSEQLHLMLGKVAKAYPLMIVMGLMIVVIAFAIGLFNSADAADYYATDKITRETLMTGTRASIENTDIWLPVFKFLGLGMILSGIAMALRVIADNLRNVGKEVLPVERHGDLPAPPWFSWLMPLFMMLGMVILFVALGVGIWAATVANDVYSNPIPLIDSAGAGSALLSDLSTVNEVKSWLTPLKFVGVATEFFAIVMGLATIIFILDRQTKVIDDALADDTVK